jgi:hypothetical protein
VKREPIHSHCGLDVRGTHSQYLLDLSGIWSENQPWRRPVKGVSSTFFRTYLYVRKARAKRFIAMDFSAKTSMGD